MYLPVYPELDISKSVADLSNFGTSVNDDGEVSFPVATKDSDGNPLRVGGAPLGAHVTVAKRKGDAGIAIIF